MKKIILTAFTLYFHSIASLHAQAASPLSGIYQKLTLGVDPARGTVTGYYSHIEEPPNLPRSECSFFLSGKMQGDKYSIQTWNPGKAKSGAIPGELTVFSGEKGQPSAQLKLEKLNRDCTQLNPKLGKAEGALLDKSKAGAWTEVRIVGNSKSRYFQTPDLASAQRGNARRGTVLTVTDRQVGWVQVQADQKPKGWVPESDLYPLSPDEAMPAPVQPAALAAPKAEAKNELKSAPKPDPVPEVKTASRADLLPRLKALNAEAFGLALRVLNNPAERSSLLSRQTALEKELNALVNALNKVDPAAYQSEATRIYEAYLDLQFVRQEQPVVSLRLRQEIRKN